MYLGTDIELIKPLDDLLESDSCYIGVQQDEHLYNTGLGFGAMKASPVVWKMLSMYDGQTFKWERAELLACPKSNDAVVRAMGYNDDGMGDVERLDGLVVYSYRYFDSIAPGDLRNLMREDTVSISPYANSWGSKGARLRRFVASALGPQKVDRLKRTLKRFFN